MADLSPDQQNAAGIISSLLDQWGLSGLSPTVLDLIQKSQQPGAITYQLSQTPQYKQRFAANDVRVKRGLAPLKPADYIATEQSYRDIMRAAGLPSGFYDNHDSLNQFIANDVSPTELKGRVDLAVNASKQADPYTRQALQDYYGVGDGHIAAYFLDQQKALPLLQQQAQAADIGGAALRAGLGETDRNAALGYAAQGVTGSQAINAYGQISGILPQEQAIANRYGQQYSQGDAEQEFLGGLASAQRARRNLNNQEVAQFQGAGGVGSTFYHPDYGLAPDQSSGSF